MEVALLRLAVRKTKTGVTRAIQRHLLCERLGKIIQDSATPAGFEPEYGPNRFADLQSSIEKLRVPLGAVGIAWRHQKAVEMGP